MVAVVAPEYTTVEVDGVNTSVAEITKGVPKVERVIVLELASNVLVPEEETIVRTPVIVKFPPAVVV